MIKRTLKFILFFGDGEMAGCFYSWAPLFDNWKIELPKEQTGCIPNVTSFHGELAASAIPRPHLGKVEVPKCHLLRRTCAKYPITFGVNRFYTGLFSTHGGNFTCFRVLNALTNYSHAMYNDVSVPKLT